MSTKEAPLKLRILYVHSRGYRSTRNRLIKAPKNGYSRPCHHHILLRNTKVTLAGSVVKIRWKVWNQSHMKTSTVKCMVKDSPTFGLSLRDRLHSPLFYPAHNAGESPKNPKKSWLLLSVAPGFRVTQPDLHARRLQQPERQVGMCVYKVGTNTCESHG